MAGLFAFPGSGMLLAEGGGAVPAVKLFQEGPSTFTVLVILIAVILIVWWLLTYNKQFSEAETGGHGHEDHGHADHGHDDHGHEAHAEPAHAEPAHDEAHAEPEVKAVEIPETAEPLPAPGAAPEEIMAPEIAPQPVPDDLKIIEGIGPKISSLLAAEGIVTFAQLAGTPVERLTEIMLAANLRIADPTTWPAQAKLAAEGKFEELQTLQDSLKGGRAA